MNDKKPHVLSRLTVAVTSRELLSRIQTARPVPEITRTAEEALDRTRKMPQPGIVYRWLEVERTGKTQAQAVIPGTRRALNFNLGFSCKFLKPARQILIAVYTAG